MIIGFIHEYNEESYSIYYFLTFILFFLILIIDQLSVWKVSDSSDGLILSNFLGLNKVVFPHGDDFISVAATINYRFETGNEEGIHLKLESKKGNFSFYSRNYRNFDQLLEILFCERQDLLHDFNKQLSHKRKKHIDKTWLFFVLAIVFLIISGIIKS